MKHAFDAYAETDRITGVAAARPVELVVMVYERIFDHLSTAAQAIRDGHSADSPLIKGIDLINEGLLACLNDEQGGDIASNLRSVYQWAMRQLMSARLRPDAQVVTEVRDTLTQLADGWRTLAQQEANTRYVHRLDPVSEGSAVGLRTSFST